MIYFSFELCDTCGRADMLVAKIVRKRIYDLDETRRNMVSYICVIKIGLYREYHTITIPHTDAIPGTSFGPILRAHIYTYRDGHTTEKDIREFL